VRPIVELWEILRAALSAIRANLLRATLTMLGIIIGVGAVITMVALGEGAKQSVQDRIQALGTDNFTLRSGNFTMGGITRGEVPLTVEDAEALEQRATTIAAIVPEMRGNQQVERGITNASLNVTGTTANWLDVNRFELDVGRFLTPEDLEGRRKVTVLGSAVLPQLETTAREVLGEEVTIAGLRFEVVGVMKEKGGATFSNPDEQLLIPLTTARLRIFGRDSLSSITIQATSPQGVDRSMLEIEKLMRRQHRLHEGQENNFRFLRQSSLLSTFEETSRTFAILLAAIAAVSLAVGGIGIMNIMLVSVTERTREIGVRKALGATRRVILSQFLAEALTLCLLGGAIGVAAGFGASHLLARSAGWRTIVTGNSVALAVAVSAGVGIFFGLYPAARASRLDPIEALRYE
jgi:putative ABC transport system permease protein